MRSASTARSYFASVARTLLCAFSTAAVARLRSVSSFWRSFEASFSARFSCLTCDSAARRAASSWLERAALRPSLPSISSILRSASSSALRAFDDFSRARSSCEVFSLLPVVPTPELLLTVIRRPPSPRRPTPIIAPAVHACRLVAAANHGACGNWERAIRVGAHAGSGRRWRHGRQRAANGAGAGRIGAGLAPEERRRRAGRRRPSRARRAPGPAGRSGRTDEPGLSLHQPRTAERRPGTQSAFSFPSSLSAMSSSWWTCSRSSTSNTTSRTRSTWLGADATTFA